MVVTSRACLSSAGFNIPETVMSKFDRRYSGMVRST